jgi:hypothetical protein
MGRLFIFLVLFATKVMAQPVPSAQELATAKDYTQQAETFADAGDCRMAVGGFEKAYQISKDPSILPMLSQCYQQLQREDEALQTACWYQEKAVFSKDRDSARQRVENLSQEIDSSCQEFPKVDGTSYAPALEVKEPPKLRRFVWPTTFAVAGGYFTAKTLTTETNKENLSYGASLAFSSMALSLYSVADKSRIYPSFWVNTDGTINANLYLSLPQGSVSLTLVTQTDGATLLVDIAKKISQ